MLLFIIATILLFCVLVLLCRPDPRNGILLLLPSMGVIAGTWDVSFAGLSLIKITYGFVAIIMIAKIRTASYLLPQWWRKTAIVFALASVIGVIWRPIYLDISPIPIIDLFLRALNFYLGFFLFPIYFHTREDFKRLIYMIVFSAIFPLLVEYYQIITGTVFNLRQTRGLTRMVGLYHDAFTNKMFYQQALISIILLLGTKLETLKSKKNLLFIFSGFLLVGCYFIFSKSMVAFLFLWTIFLITIGKKIHWGIIVVVFVLLINEYMEGKIFDNVYNIFEKDIQVQQGQIDQKYLLSGRGGLWEEDTKQFNEFGSFAYIFGAGWTPAAHNEWLRVFYLGGFISLAFFIGCQLIILQHLIQSYFIQKQFYRLVAMLIFFSYLIDCIGVVPGLYPSYNWFIWGILGCLLVHGDKYFSTNPSTPALASHPSLST